MEPISRLQGKVWFFLLFLGFSWLGLAQDIEEASVRVRGTSTIAETDDNFICATLDWWPPEKCNYGNCPWGEASVLNLDLNHPLLANAVKAFGNLRIRIGGTLQDRVLYDVGGLEHPCLPFQKKDDGLFGFSKGCLKMERWDELNQLFIKTGVTVTFGLNALNGRRQAPKGEWGSPWNSTNAYNFIKYTVTKGYKVDSWEFGNELSGSGVGARVNAKQYAEDLINLKSLLAQLYKDPSPKPLLVAPGGFFDQPWYTQLLHDSGPEIVDALTHHIYNLGAGVDPNLVSRILDPAHSNSIAKTFIDLQLAIQNSGPWSSAWVGEAGGAYNSGGKLISDTFVNSFWYLDQLGMAAMYNTKVYCRQSLIGGYYSLLDTSTFIPNPDYYSALLWHQLMGKGVLATEVVGSQYLRAYAHCSREKDGITVLLINLSNTTTFSVGVENDVNLNLHLGGKSDQEGSVIHSLKKKFAWFGKLASNGNEQRYEYHLTPKDGYLRSQTMLLNGRPLELTGTGEIPSLEPILVNSSSKITIAPFSIAFITLPNFEAAAACS
ncbi:unnamed protein product [Victoria cruziana]